MDGGDFEAAVRARVGLMNGPRFRAAVRAALETLAAHAGLPAARMQAVLPPDLAAALPEPMHSPIDPPSVYLRVAATARLHVGVTIQIVRAVLAELAERVGPEGRDELRLELPPEWADLVVEPASTRADES